MDLKRASFFFLLVLTLVMGLSACERSLAPKSTREPEAASTDATRPPAGTGDVLGQLQLFATQTAMAVSGPGEVLMTPEPVLALPTELAASPTAAPLTGDMTAATATPAPVVEATTAPIEPTEAVVVVPTATPGLPNKYTLEANEFPYCIARRFDIDPAELLNANGLGTNTTLSTGTTLKIPKDARPFPGKRSLLAHPTTHTVQAGETIYSIACMYGDVDPNAIIYANALKAPYVLKAGQSLQVP